MDTNPPAPEAPPYFYCACGNATPVIHGELLVITGEYVYLMASGTAICQRCGRVRRWKSREQRQMEIERRAKGGRA